MGSIIFRIKLEKLLPPVQINLIKTLHRKGPLTREDLAIQLKIPRSTIYDNLRKLQKRKLVEKYILWEGKQGRPPVYWKSAVS